MSRRPGVRYHAAFATSPLGAMALAIAHMEPDGEAVLDEVKEMMVAGGEAGVDAVYSALRAQGIAVADYRSQAGDRTGTARSRAIADALAMARAS
jgi:hypothetical protein